MKNKLIKLRKKALFHFFKTFNTIKHLKNAKINFATPEKLDFGKSIKFEFDFFLK
jgi:hypothetical protein